MWKVAMPFPTVTQFNSYIYGMECNWLKRAKNVFNSMNHKYYSNAYSRVQKNS